jgi:hypothetical protein
MTNLSNPALWHKICDRKITDHLTLFQQLKDSPSFVSLVIWYDVLFPINNLSITMQSKIFSLHFVLLPSSTYLFTAGVEGFSFALDHTQTHTTLGRTPLHEGSARRRDLYLTTQTLYKRQTSMPLVGFDPTIPASASPQTYALDHAATGIGTKSFTFANL